MIAGLQESIFSFSLAPNLRTSNCKRNPGYMSPLPFTSEPRKQGADSKDCLTYSEW